MKQILLIITNFAILIYFYLNPTIVEGKKILFSDGSVQVFLTSELLTNFMTDGSYVSLTACIGLIVLIFSSFILLITQS